MAGSRARRRVRWLLVLSLAVLLPAVLVLEGAPVAARSAAPTADDVRGAKAIYDAIRAAQGTPGSDLMHLEWQQLSAAAVLGGRAGGVERIEVVRTTDGAILRASKPLPLGLWLNGQLRAKIDDSQHLDLSARLGDLPVPAFAVHAAIAVARGVLGLRGADIPPLDTMVSEVRTDSRGMTAVVDIPSRTGVFSSLSGLFSERIDAARVGDHYCRLVAAQRETPSLQFSEQVNRAFRAGDGTPPDNRALFVALSLLVAQVDAKGIPDERALMNRCGVLQEEVLLQGRADLAKHWAVSAALASVLGPDASLSVGTWKEISDSGAGGSGFSLVDLAADRSGVFSARRGADPATSLALRDWLGRTGEEDLVPVAALALAEGMTEAEFRSRYTDTDSEKFAATVSRIDAQLAALQH